MTPDRRTAGVTTTPTVPNRLASKTADAQSVLETPDRGSDLDQLVRGALVVIVRVDADHYRRRTYLSLKSAQHAADRARERGHDVTVVLCELLPVGRCP